MDIELVENAKNGDKESLLRLIMDRKSEFYKLAYTYTENSEDALDAMEDMTAILYNKINKLNNDQAFYSWSKTILVNCCRDIVRKKGRAILLEEIPEQSCGSVFEDRNIRMDIFKVLKTLNQYQEEAIKLRYFMDMDYESIARLVKTPVGTVKSRISTGLKKLKECLGGEY